MKKQHIARVLVSRFLASGFLDVRPFLVQRYPLFYSLSAPVGPVTTPWTPQDLERVDALYLLYTDRTPLTSAPLPPAPSTLSIAHGSSDLAALLWAARPRIGTAANVHTVPLSCAGRRHIAPVLHSRSREALSEPHAYIFAPGGAVTLLENATEGTTELCRRYRGVSGAVMWPLDGPLPKIAVSDTASHIAIFVFYRVSHETVVPVYDVISRGYAEVGAHRLVTFVGPLTSTYVVDPDTFRTTRNFKYERDCVFSLSGPEAPQPQELPDAPLRFFDDATELALNRYTEALYGRVAKLGNTAPQSFIYRGLNALVPITTVAYLCVDETLGEAVFANSVKRTCARNGITEPEFCAALLSPGSESDARRRRLFYEAANVINTLRYREDTIGARHVDVHESIRLTNTGDCEDSAEAMFRIIRRLQTWTPPEKTSPGVRALCTFAQSPGLAALFMHMFVKFEGGDSHTVSGAAFLSESPRGSADARFSADSQRAMFFMEATGVERLDEFFPEGSWSTQDRERAEVVWRMQMAHAIPADSTLEFFSEPLAAAPISSSRKRDHGLRESSAQGSSSRMGNASGALRFYQGFIGALVALPGRLPTYCFFAERGHALSGSAHGLGVTQVAVDSEYDLVPLLKEEDHPDAHAAMKKIALFAPPLPLPSTGDFPAEYLSWLSKAKRIEKGSPAAATTRKTAFSVFLNLCETAAQLEKEIDVIRELANRAQVVVVTGFSLFRGSAVIEVNFR